ncbi:MAG: hypothetical protein PHQ23_15840 [Candidatus Wallbacteria bacterium]|nr:hypothetical protein [Candidatus Wallbacteria bacterium]
MNTIGRINVRFTKNCATLLAMFSLLFCSGVSHAASGYDSWVLIIYTAAADFPGTGCPTKVVARNAGYGIADLEEAMKLAQDNAEAIVTKVNSQIAAEIGEGVFFACDFITAVWESSQQHVYLPEFRLRITEKETGAEIIDVRSVVFDGADFSQVRVFQSREQALAWAAESKFITEIKTSELNWIAQQTNLSPDQVELTVEFDTQLLIAWD